MEEKEEEKKPAQKQISISREALYVLFACIALALVIIVRVLVVFGVYSGVLSGIMFILACGLTIAGMTMAYISNRQLVAEFWLNLAVLAITCVALY